MAEEKGMKEGKAKIEVETNMAEVRAVIGRPETERLIKKGEHAAALLVTAVDLEFVLQKHLERYRDANGGSVRNDDVKSVINNLNECYVGTFKTTFDEIYSENDCPEYSEMQKVEWDKYEPELSQLIDIRNDIAHEKGAFTEIWRNAYEGLENKSEVEDLIETVYEFCDQNPY